METLTFAGLQINRMSWRRFFFNRTMLAGYVLFALGLFGVYEIFELRYFSGAVSAHAIAMDPQNAAIKESMHQAIFGSVGEINRNLPWTLLIVNYMYMVYTGSGIIFLVALAELMNFRLVAKAAAGFMALGLSMIFAGLFTIATDLNMANMLWMVLTPNYKAGMWLMLPLYSTYIPFVFFEIYLLLSNKKILAKHFALPLLVLSLIIDVTEYYIQAKLFSMNMARHLWTEFPVLTFYFIISAFVTALGIMGITLFKVHRRKDEFAELAELVRKALLFFIFILALYEIVGYMTVDKDWAFLILFGPFSSIYFLGYILLSLALPFILLLQPGKPLRLFIAAVSAAIGGFIGRYLFVYGGNASPMSDRFGMGYEKYSLYSVSDSFVYESPHVAEILIVIGSVGVALIIYRIFESLFSVEKLRGHG